MRVFALNEDFLLQKFHLLNLMITCVNWMMLMDMKCCPWLAVSKPLLVPDVERINEFL